MHTVHSEETLTERTPVSQVDTMSMVNFTNLHHAADQRNNFAVGRLYPE